MTPAITAAIPALPPAQAAALQVVLDQLFKPGAVLNAKVAQVLDALPGVAQWVRNLEHSRKICFWLQALSRSAISFLSSSSRRLSSGVGTWIAGSGSGMP